MAMCIGLGAALQVAVLYGQPVFKVTATKLIKPTATFDAGESRCGILTPCAPAYCGINMIRARTSTLPHQMTPAAQPCQTAIHNL
jgi:hypothetical protein